MSAAAPSPPSGSGPRRRSSPEWGGSVDAAHFEVAGTHSALDSLACTDTGVTPAPTPRTTRPARESGTSAAAS
jgi:hypothetical protein